MRVRSNSEYTNFKNIQMECGSGIIPNIQIEDTKKWPKPAIEEFLLLFLAGLSIPHSILLKGTLASHIPQISS